MFAVRRLTDWQDVRSDAYLTAGEQVTRVTTVVHVMVSFRSMSAEPCWWLKDRSSV